MDYKEKEEIANKIWAAIQEDVTKHDYFSLLANVKLLESLDFYVAD